MTTLDLPQSILDALPLQVVVTDGGGTIVYANAAWDNAARAAGVHEVASVSVGSNYLAATTRSAENGDAIAADALLGLQAVGSGASDYFEIEYPCPGRTGRQWYLMRVTPLAGAPPRSLVIAHTDVTQSRRKLAKVLAAQHEVEQRDQQEREMVSLESISSQPVTSVTATLYGKLPVRETNQAIFGSLVSRYCQILNRAVEQRTYRIDHTLDDDLREIAQRLRFQNGGPRDVLDIHLAAIKVELRRAAGTNTTLLVEESRSVVLQLMGNLLSLYRLEAIATRQSFAARDSE